MSILLSHNSSLECLRAIPPQADMLKQTTLPLRLEDVVPAKGELRWHDLEKLGITQKPLHHLIPVEVRRNETHGIKSHHTSMEVVPNSLVRRLAPDVFVCGPEITFVQMAASMSLVGAVVLGHELCGTYSHFARFISGFYERPALTSVEKLSRSIEALEGQGMYGLGPAREALRWVRDGSASPMETVVSCMLHLPTAIGGFGLVAPELNVEQELDDAAQRIAKKQVCRVDTGYVYEVGKSKHKVGLEYDGKDYHRDAEKDRVRREALTHMGWSIYVVIVDDMTSYSRIKDKVALLGDVPRQQRSGEVDEYKGRELLDRLLRSTRFGVGMNSVLFGVDVTRRHVKVHL